MDPKQTKLQKYADIQALVQQEIKTQFPKLYAEQATKYGVAEVPLHRHNGFDAPQIRMQDIVQSLATTGSVNLATDGQRYLIGVNAKPGSGFCPSIVRFNGAAVYTLTTFTISSSTVNSGAIYTAEGLSFKVLTSISPGVSLATEGPGGVLTANSGTLTKVSGTGPSTISYTNVAASNTIRAFIVGDAFIGPSFYLQPLSTTEVTIGGPPQAVVQSSSALIINDSGSGPVTRAPVSTGHVVSATFPTNSDIVARATIPDFGDFGAADGPIQNGALAVDVTLASGWSIAGNFTIM